MWYNIRPKWVGSEVFTANNETEGQSPLRLPDLLMVITGGAFAYTRPDGVIVCPLSALRP